MNFHKIFDFIHSHYPNKARIGLHEPVFRGREKEYVNDAIDSTFVSSVGAYVDRFEAMVQERLHVSKAIAIVNGTCALQLALQLAGVKSNEEVVTQSLTFVATANAISHIGAAPVFVDVDRNTMGMSAFSLMKFFDTYGQKRSSGVFNTITGRRIAAVVPMHTFGFPVDLDGLLDVCNHWGIPLVEDAAEGLGSFYRERPVGSLGKLGVLSFNGNKIITTGGGGMILTNDLNLGNRAKHLSTTAKVPHLFEFIHDDVGYNFRMPNLNAALGCAQLEMLDEYLLCKRRLAESYSKFFETMGISFRMETKGTQANYWLMTIELSNSRERDLFLKEMNAMGVMCRPAWKLLFRLPMYSSCMRDDQSNSIWLEDRIVNIPSGVV